MQILFPDPVMARLRAVARQQDRPVSELVRRAVDRLLEQAPAIPAKPPARFPTFRGGGVQVEAGRLKEVLHGFDEEADQPGKRASRAARRRKR